MFNYIVPRVKQMPIGDKEKKNTVVSAAAPPASEPRANAGSNDYTLTGDQDADLDNIATHYKPEDLDDTTWRGMWKSVFAGESTSNLNEGESKYGKLPKGQRAVGGMQVLPKTAKGLGFTDEEFKDPYYRFMAGVKNLRTEWDEIGKDKRVTSPEHRAALTFAAYHAGRGNVIASLNKGEDGVPNVDDGGINTRDYAFNKFDALKNYLQQNGTPESDEPALKTDEEVGARSVTESGEPARESEQPPNGGMKKVGSVLLGDVTAPGARKTLEEELVDTDRRTREALGLIVPASAPRNFTGKAPTITMEVRRAQDGTLDVDENTLTDAVVFALTGDNNLGQQFRQSVGENPGQFNYDITKQWLNEQVQAGNLKLSEADGRLFVQGNVPVQNYVKNRLEAFAHEGAPGVARVTSEMSEETNQYERLAAEEGYGRRIMELRARAEELDKKNGKTVVNPRAEGQNVFGGVDAKFISDPEAVELRKQADSLEAELEARYPTNWMDETWRGFKTGLARGMYNVSRTGMNIKGLAEVFGMSDKEKVEATQRDKRVRAMEAALNGETPQARRWLGQAADAVTSELVYTPIYISGGMMMGPAGGIMTQALRSANKPMDEAMEDIASAIFELGAGSLIKGKWLAGKGVSPRKEFLSEMAIGGFTEAGGDAVVSLAEGKGIDWNNALMNLVIGAGMEAGFGAREALKNQHHAEGEGDVKFDTESAGAVQFDTEIRSPVFITRGENGQPRFGAVVRQGNSAGFIEIPNQHPIIMKHTIDVEEGKASFVATDAENFDKALTDWKGTAEGIKLPKLNAAQLAQYLRGENPMVNEQRDAKLKSAIDNGATNDSEIGQRLQSEVGVGQESVEGRTQPRSSGEPTTASGVLQTPLGEQVSGQQAQSQVEGEAGKQTQAKGNASGNGEVLNEPKTYRKYKNIQHALDRDLAQQWDKAKDERDEAYKVAVTGQNGELNQGAMIRAGHVFTAARRDILAEQEKRDKAKETKGPEAKKTTTKEEKPFEAGRVVSSGGVNVTLPPNLAARWNRIQDDFKGAKEAIEKDNDLTLDEKKKKVNEIKRQKLDEQTRLMNEYKKQQAESEQRGYAKGSNRPLKIIEDRGDEVEVKIAGEDATRVLPRDEIETRKERTLARTSKTKLPLSVRTKSFFGTFNESRAASHASDGIVYINSSTQSKVEDALGYEVGTGYTFNADTLDDTLKTLRDAGLNKLADQLESQKKAANGAPAIVNVNTESAGLALSHEKVHQGASGKDLPRSVVERLMKDDGNIDKMLKEVDDHPIKDLDPDDVIHEILAYGLTGDFDTLGVAPDFLYDALLDVVEAYVGAFPNEDLDTIFDRAIVDIDTIKDEANRRIKYGAENKPTGAKAVQTTGNKTEAGKETGGEGAVAGEVSKTRIATAGRSYGEADILSEIRTMAKGKADAPISIADLRKKIPEFTKEQFDEGVENLSNAGDIFVQRQDNANQLTEAQRDDLVKIGKDYHNAITLPERAKRGLSRVTKKDVENSKEFKEWFEDSKAVDEDGKPVLVYHGTLKEIDKFDATKRGKNVAFPVSRLGIFFSPKPEVASRYAPVVDYGHPSVHPVYLNMKKPYTMDEAEFARLDFPKDGALTGEESVDNFREKLISEGYDGVIVEKKSPAVSEYIVFDGDQVRSVFSFKAAKAKSGLARQTVESKESVADIERKPTEDVTPENIKTVVNNGRFAAISGGEKTAKLKNELDRMGFKVFDAEGNYKSGKKTKSEPSLFVILSAEGDEAQLIRLATRFKQANVLLGDAGKYRSPFTSAEQEAVSAKNKALFDQEADKQAGNTLVKTENGDISFSIPDIDSDIRPSDEKEREAVAEMTRAYDKSFENKAKATTADLTQFLQKQMDLKKRKQRQIAEVGQFLEETVKKMYGEYPDESLPQGEYDAQRVRRAKADLLSILQYEFGHSNKDIDETGMSWYTSSIEKMHQRTGQAFPEVLNMPQMRLLYDLTLALSSPANKVNSNYKYTAQLWTRMIDEFELGMEGPRIYPTKQKAMTRDKETGQMRPKKYGKFGPLLDKFNNMSEGWIPVPSTDVDKVRESGAEMRQTTDFADVKGATQWYAKEPELDRLIKKYGKIGGVFEYMLSPGKEKTDRFRATEVLGPKVGAFFLNIAGFSQLVTVDSWISRWFYMLNGGLVNESEKYGVQDSPKQDRDGDLIRGVMQAVAKEWNKSNPELQISPEDVQAMAWYHIKNIFFLAGAKDSGNVDFHQAAQSVLAQPEIVADIDGTAANREAVLERFKQDTTNALGPLASKAGTKEAEKQGRDFQVQQMAAPARGGLAHTKRKDVVNRKLSNFDSVEWNKFAERAKGDELELGEKKILYSLLQKGYQATTEKSRLKVKEDLIDFCNNISSQGVAEFLLTLRKAGMLSGIKTTGRNILSNTAYAVLEEMNRGLMGPLDVVLSTLRGTERSVQGVSPVGIARALGKAGTEGLKQFKDTMLKGNAAVSFEDIGYDPKLRPYIKMFGKQIPFATGAWFMNKTVGNFAKYVFRFQKAQDVVFRTYAYNRSLYEVAKLKEKNEKIPVADTLANPTAADSDVAWRAAEVMVFQNENALNTAYQRFKSKQPKAVKYLLDYQLPFIKTGSNIFNATMDYLGVGGAYKVAKLFNDMNDADWAKGKNKMWAAIDNPAARKVIIGAFSRGLVGLGIASIGWFLAAAGMANGMDDDDEKERNRRIAEGSGPGHIKVNGKWLDIRSISPVGTILLSGASAWRAMNKDMKDESKRYDAMLAIASDILVDGLPLARTASDYVNPKSGRSVAQRAIGADSLVPSIVSEVAAAQDTVQRNTKGDTLGESIKKSVQVRLPKTKLNPEFNRQSLPAKTDVFGKELAEPSPGPLVPLAGALSPKNAKEDKVLKEASEVGWSMTPPKRDTKNKETAEVFETRKRKIEDLVYKVFDKVVNDPGYSSDFTKPERKGILDEAAGIARRTVKNEGKLTDNEIKDVVKAVLEKAKVEAGIDKDAKMDAKTKAKAKQSVSTQFSSFLGGPTKD